MVAIKFKLFSSCFFFMFHGNVQLKVVVVVAFEVDLVLCKLSLSIKNFSFKVSSEMSNLKFATIAFRFLRCFQIFMFQFKNV
jgi:hypothetical protein